MSLHSHSQSSVGRGRRGHPRPRDGGGGRDRPQLLDGVVVVLVSLAAVLVEIVLEKLVHRPGDGRRRRLVQHPRGQTLREIRYTIFWFRFVSLSSVTGKSSSIFRLLFR